MQFPTFADTTPRPSVADFIQVAEPGELALAGYPRTRSRTRRTRRKRSVKKRKTKKKRKGRKRRKGRKGRKGRKRRKGRRKRSTKKSVTFSKGKLRGIRADGRKFSVPFQRFIRTFPARTVQRQLYKIKVARRRRR